MPPAAPSTHPARTTTTTPWRSLRRRRDERGAVAAEAAVVLPTLVLLTVALAWLVTVGLTQVRLVDAAREAARAAARSDSDSAAAALGRRVAPDGARVEVRRSGDEVVVRVSAPVRGPGGVFRLAPVTLSSQAVAAQEPTAGSGW